MHFSSELELQNVKNVINNVKKGYIMQEQILLNSSISTKEKLLLKFLSHKYLLL